MTDNPYQGPIALEESTDARSPLANVAVSLIIVLVLWVLMAPIGMAYLISVIRAPDTEMETYRFYTINILYMSISILYSLLLVSGAFSMARRGSYMRAVSTSWLAMVPMVGPSPVNAALSNQMSALSRISEFEYCSIVCGEIGSSSDTSAT
jgi:hypothetical protein